MLKMVVMLKFYVKIVYAKKRGRKMIWRPLGWSRMPNWWPLVFEAAKPFSGIGKTRIPVKKGSVLIFFYLLRYK